MKKRIFSVVVTLVLGTCVVFAFAGQQCQKPNVSTKACYEPNDQVQSCNDVAPATCLNSQGLHPSYYTYEIEQFPDGTVVASTGVTKTESSKCWRKTKCIWVTRENRYPECEPQEYWSTWVQGQKTVVNSELSCPSE
jgi:hypothetical protein